MSPETTNSAPKKSKNDPPIWIIWIFLLINIAAITFIIYDRNHKKNELSSLIGYNILQPQKITAPVAFPEIKDLNGQKQSISGGNKPILVHFWGTWCPFCLRELPSFTNFAATYRDKFTIMFVAIDDKDEAVINFINDNQLPLPVLRASYKGSVPVSFLLDKSGQPRFRFDGAKPWNAPHAQAAMEELFHSLQ